MKLFAVSSVFLLFASLVIMASVISGKLELESYPPATLMVTNLSDKAIPVYLDKAEANKIVMYLEPDLSLPFAYSGKTGEWKYVFIDEGLVVTLRSKNIGFSYRVSENTTILTGTVNTIYWVSLVGSIASFLTLMILLVFKALSGRDVQVTDVDDEYKLDLDFHKPEDSKEDFEKTRPPNSENLITPAILDQNTEQKAIQAKKAENEAQLKKAQLAEKLKAEQLKAEKLKAEQERKNREQIAAKKASDAALVAAQQAAKQQSNKDNATLSEGSKREIARLRHELIVTANAESKARYRGEATLVQMRASYDRLFDKYKEIKSEAESLGIQFDDLKYKDLLKSRGYQIFLVTSLMSNKKYTVLEWMPGKGYDADFSVESNTSPNLLVQDNSGNVIGLVCKYRSGYYLANNKKEICWASDKQAEQYKKFSKSRNVPVLVAIGLRGKYNAPKYNFLVSLADIGEKSNREVGSDSGFQLVLNSTSILDSLIKSADYDNFLEAKMKQLKLK